MAIDAPMTLVANGWTTSRARPRCVPRWPSPPACRRGRRCRRAPGGLVDGRPHRVLVGDVAGHGAYVGTNGLAFPIGLFGAAAAGVPFVPLNYRLSDTQLHDLLVPLGETLVIAEGPVGDALRAHGHKVVDVDEFVALARTGAPVGDVPDDGESPAVLLFTSGTTGAPKAAMLRHRHLTSYVIGTVEFGGSGQEEAVLVSVPPTTSPASAKVLSNVYRGRRIVYLGRWIPGPNVGTRSAPSTSPTPWWSPRCWRRIPTSSTSGASLPAP